MTLHKNLIYIFLLFTLHCGVSMVNHGCEDMIPLEKIIYRMSYVVRMKLNVKLIRYNSRMDIVNIIIIVFYYYMTNN